MATHKVFCYGTLRPGNPEKTVIIPGVMYDLGPFPGIHLSEGPGFVAEVVEVSDEVLARLDSYEGYYASNPEHSLYLRKRHLDGWIYEYNNESPNGSVVPGGDWLAHTGRDRGSAASFVTE